VGVRKPLRTRIVEVGERALLQFLGRVLADRQDTVGIAEHDLGLGHDEVGAG
jgi:hypothetical protein